MARTLVSRLQQRVTKTCRRYTASHTETSPLLKSIYGPSSPTDTCHIQDLLEEQHTVPMGNPRASWPLEARIITTSALPLAVTFLLQYSVDTFSLIAAGKMGKLELGAVSLANLSAAITCFAPIQGLATSLDTLCAQAYGSGDKHLIGRYCQRMTLFLFCLLVPISLLWLYSESIIIHVVSDAQAAHLTSLYLRVLLFGVPGYILFETGKRFLQAQGLFRATTYILVIAAPCHVLLISFLVGKLGFIGAPLAVAITRTLIPILLILYVKFINGSSCWGGFSSHAFTNWYTMIRLAIPGMIVVEAEYLAFEVMILISGRFGIDYLAAQSILVAVATISFQIPFSVSIAASTRIASLIGAGLVDSARVAAKVAVVATCITGLANLFIYNAFRLRLPYIFTNDPAVAALTSTVLPLLSVTCCFEGLAATAHGLLRGIGRQYIGGPATLSAYYLVALPCALAFGLVLDWKCHGLILGLTLGLVVVLLIEYTYLCLTDWRKTAAEAAIRNAAG
ncbi:hypothetical protein CDD81_2588 [Ophiocordyceps australis]|uniref:MATE efflux family protein n=1 Tax=Ophiocordyceps australis TaxID=1399860 RepID=A0A2C5XYK8_9HYPO|nr:hypothetical protein CDD81_2588 [Ophiocordyceps australis]